jgi:hypothetical protein
VQRAVKTVGPKVKESGIKEFTTEAAIQLKLKHKHIVEVIGVCMKQRPVNYFINFRSFRPLFFARALWQIALPPLGGVAAICHRPLGVWHPKKVAKPDQF